MGHMQQYPEDTTEVYSYLEARKPEHEIIFFGLQYILKTYLSQSITSNDVDEFLSVYKRILGDVPEDVKAKVIALSKLGYWPVEIKAVPEGTVLPTQNILLSIRNTHPDFYWCVGFLESMLLKLWNPCTIATYSLKYRQLVERYAELTCDDNNHIPFQVHDFGYRGVSSEETASISGAAHLLNFYGSDTVLANWFISQYYTPDNKDTIISLSVPASEHSVMCSYGRNREWHAFDRMLELYPKGIVSIVSDTYDYWDILTRYVPFRRNEILNRDGKTVLRPDSGDPIKVICGDPDHPDSLSPQALGSLELLWQEFGGYYNSKGYRVLNPKVGLIYGDGMYYERFEQMLETMRKNGFATSNLVIGVGGILLQNHNRDEYGFALKATHIVRNGRPIEIYKDPITDKSKKSKKGFMRLDKTITGQYITTDKLPIDEGGYLEPVFRDGQVLRTYSIEQVRKNVFSRN